MISKYRLKCFFLMAVVLNACSPKIQNNSSTKVNTITVNNVNDFFRAIQNDVKIILEAGDYIVPSLEELPIATKFIDDKHIAHVKNVEIEGRGEVRFLQPDGYQYVLRFRNVKNVKIRDVTMGHSPGLGYCKGGVLLFRESKNITLTNLKLFGSGTEGLTLLSADNVVLKDSKIYECTEQLSTLSNSTNVTYENVRVENNAKKLLRGFAIYKSELHFKKCFINEDQFEFSMKVSDYDKSYGTYFRIDAYDFGNWHRSNEETKEEFHFSLKESKITFYDTTINGNVINGRIE